jgi:hypothetical protein
MTFVLPAMDLPKFAPAGRARLRPGEGQAARRQAVEATTKRPTRKLFYRMRLQLCLPPAAGMAAPQPAPAALRKRRYFTSDPS